MSVCGPSTYQLIRSLVALTKPSSKTFVELVELVKTHFNTKPLAIVSRFKVTSCVRSHGESVSSIVVRLQQLMEYCKYGASLEEMLRDRLIGGTNDKRLQRRYSLSRRPLTWRRHTCLLQRTSRTYKRRSCQGKYTLCVLTIVTSCRKAL